MPNVEYPPMTKKELEAARKRWHDLSMVCWCREDAICSACLEQDGIRAKVESEGYNLFTGERKRTE